jgi:hypothetical protein
VKQYLLSVYQPDGDLPAPEMLGKIMQDVGAWNTELKAAGTWVFTAGLCPNARGFRHLGGLGGWCGSAGFGYGK